MDAWTDCLELAFRYLCHSFQTVKGRRANTLLSSAAAIAGLYFPVSWRFLFHCNVLGFKTMWYTSAAFPVVTYLRPPAPVGVCELCMSFHITKEHEDKAKWPAKISHSISGSLKEGHIAGLAGANLPPLPTIQIRGGNQLVHLWVRVTAPKDSVRTGRLI